MKSFYQKKEIFYPALGLLLGLSLWLITSKGYIDSIYYTKNSELLTNGASKTQAPNSDSKALNQAGLTSDSSSRRSLLDYELEEDSEVMALAARQAAQADRDEAAFMARQAAQAQQELIKSSAANKATEDLVNRENQAAADSLFESGDLEFLEKSGAAISGRSGLIPGARSSRNTASPNNSPPSPEPTAVPDQDKPRFTGQARGYEIFYLMQPEARLAAEAQVQNIISSGLKEVYLGVLTDGTFGKDYSYLREVLDRLAEAEREITLLTYIVNGPAMRRYDDTKVITAFSQIEPTKFRRLIREDSAVQATFRSLVTELKPILEYNLQLNANNSNLVVVMLEDNLDVASYQAMRSIAASELGNLAEFMRNPCPNCYEGNDTDTAGDARVSHELENIPGLGSSDGFSLDGIGFTHTAVGNGRELPLADVSRYQDLALQRRIRFFALWNAQRQGLYGSDYPNPSERFYEVATQEELDAEQLLLQEGLEPIVEE